MPSNVNIDEIICLPGSERAILSIVLNNPDKLLECEQENLFYQHFAVKGHQVIYSVICYLYSNENVRRIDAMLIYNTIEDANAKQSVDELGGMMYIEQLILSRSADNLKLYIKQVKNCALKRLAYNMGSDIQRLVLEDNIDSTEELLETIQQKTLDLVLNNESQQEVYQMGTKLEARLQERMNNPNEIPGLSMGWTKYDKLTQGHKENELTVFVGESKTGKSVILLNHAKKWSIDDLIPGLYIDTEMTDTEQEDRLTSMISGVPYEEIFNGMFAQDTQYGRAVDKIEAVKRAVQKIKNGKLFHVYMPTFTIEKVTALVRQYTIRHNIGYAIFDYIKLPTSEIGGLANAQEYQRLGFITTCLKDLSGICGIPILTAAQANRSNLGNSNPDASNIGGSYRILQMATRMIFIRNKSDMELASEGWAKGNQQLIIKYQRNGSSDCEPINIAFDKPCSKMQEI